MELKLTESNNEKPCVLFSTRKRIKMQEDGKTLSWFIETYMCNVCTRDCYNWWDSWDATMIDQNCKVVQNSHRLVEFELIVAITTLQLSEGTN